MCEERSRRRMKSEEVTPASGAHLLFSKRTDRGTSSSIRAFHRLSCLSLEDKIGVLDPTAGRVLETHQAFNGTLKTAPQEESEQEMDQPTPRRIASNESSSTATRGGDMQLLPEATNKQPKTPLC